MIMTYNETKPISSQHDQFEPVTLLTNSDSKLFESSTAIAKITPKADFSRSIGGKKNGVDLSNFVQDSFEYLKKVLGLTPDCLNGGTKLLRGDCVCPKFFQGALCEEQICINNGTLVKTSNFAVTQYECKCPHPEYIHGVHCEFVKCSNGGRPMDNGHCECLDYWYTGQFCQEYTASWGAVLGLPMVCLVIVIICCVVCRMDLFPRKPSRSRRRRRMPPIAVSGEGISRQNHRLEAVRASARRVEAVRGNSRRTETMRSSARTETMRDNRRTDGQIQECRLSRNPHDAARMLRPEGSILSSYIIRLDTVPVFNRNLSSNVSSSKPLDPPPSYEQAIATSTPHPLNGFNSEGGVHPPDYALYALPPPPRFRPPDIPRNG